MTRSREVVRMRPIQIASPEELVDQQDVLRAVLGRLTAFTEMALLLSLSGAVVAVGAIESAGTSLDANDALLQQWRVVADGSGSGASVTVTVGGVAVGTVALGAGRAVVASEWAAPVVGVGELAVSAAVSGASATLYAVRLQARTLRAPAR